MNEGDSLVPVAADSFYWAAFHCFFAESLFFRAFRLLEDEGVTAVIIASEVGRSGFAAKIAIDALVVNVEGSCNVLRVFVREVCHSFA